MLRPKPSRSPLPRRRLRPLLGLRRHPRAWWLVAGAAAVAAGGLASSVVNRAEATRQAWGETTEVVVATRDLAPGDRLDAGALALERRPLATVPASALAELPEDQVAAAAIVEGEVVVAERLAGAGVDGVAALLPPGTRAVAIPADPSLTPPVEVGDRVDVVVALAAPEGSGPPGFTLVAEAVVVAVTDSAVSVAVPRDDTARVAVALGTGSVTLALAGGASG